MSNKNFTMLRNMKHIFHITVHILNDKTCFIKNQCKYAKILLREIYLLSHSNILKLAPYLFFLLLKYIIYLKYSENKWKQTQRFEFTAKLLLLKGGNNFSITYYWKHILDIMSFYKRISSCLLDTQNVDKFISCSSIRSSYLHLWNMNLSDVTKDHIRKSCYVIY